MDVLKNIIRESGMSSRPEFYSGRGATLCDLNSEYLQKIHNGILEKFGKKHAESYILMVARLKELSATGFLNALYALHDGGWKKPKNVVESDKFAVHKNEDGEYDAVHGQVSVMSAIFSTGRDQTNAIRSGFNHTHRVFLKKNGIEPKMYHTEFGIFSDGRW